MSPISDLFSTKEHERENNGFTLAGGSTGEPGSRWACLCRICGGYALL